MYPIPMRLADRGWLETAWETEIAAGRPPRHHYRLTKSGVAVAMEVKSANANGARARSAKLRLRAGHGLS